MQKEEKIKQLSRKLFVMCANPLMLRDQQQELSRKCLELARDYYEQEDEFFESRSRIGDLKIGEAALSEEFISLPVKRPSPGRSM